MKYDSFLKYQKLISRFVSVPMDLNKETPHDIEVSLVMKGDSVAEKSIETFSTNCIANIVDETERGEYSSKTILNQCKF